VVWLIMRGMALLSVAFLFSIGIVRFFAYDDIYLQNLANIILRDGCEAPCFMGITPDETHSRDVEAILEADARAGDLERIMVMENFTGVRWSWQEETNQDRKGQGLVNIWYGDVEWLSWQPEANYGEVVLALGQPERYAMQFREQFAFYDAHGITLRAEIDCSSWWSVDVQIVYGINISGFRAPSWGAMMRDSC
jgi:hypothetical protein